MRGVLSVLIEKASLSFILGSSNEGLRQGYKNPGCYTAQVTCLCIVALNICASSLWNFFQATFPTPEGLRRLPDFLKICKPPGCDISTSY
jgi:hypothetical protein